MENVQLKALYEEVLKHMSDNETNSNKSQQTTAAAQTNVQCWKCKYEKLEVELSRVKQQNNELEQKMIQVEAGLELECYRAESRVQKQWEAHEGRLVQQLVELQHQVKVQEVDGVLPVLTLKTEPVEANQPISENASVVNCSRTTLVSPRMEYLSLSTGTQPMRKVQWQDPIQTHSCDSEFLHQTAGSFIPLNCNPKSPVPTRGSSYLYSLVYSPAQSVNVDLLKSVLVVKIYQLSDGGCGMDIFQDWLEQFELIADVLGWSPQAKLVNFITRLQGQAYSLFRSCTMSSVLIIHC